jgi:hypothetical protein
MVPEVRLYRAGDGCVLNFPAAAYEMQQAQRILSTVLENPGERYRLDEAGDIEVVTSASTQATARATHPAEAYLAHNEGLSASARAVNMTVDAFSSHMAAAKAAFLAQWGAGYGYGGRIDELYHREVGARMPPHHHYLDYTGSSLYANSVLASVFIDLRVRAWHACVAA